MLNLTSICYRHYILRSETPTTTFHPLEHLVMAKHDVPPSSFGLMYFTNKDNGHIPVCSSSYKHQDPSLALFAHLQEAGCRVPLALATLLEPNVVFLEVLDNAFPDWAVKKMLELDSNLKYRLEYNYSLSGK